MNSMQLHTRNIASFDRILPSWDLDAPQPSTITEINGNVSITFNFENTETHTLATLTFIFGVHVQKTWKRTL